MSLQWDESLELGLEEIDSQHKSIFAQFGRLSEATEAGNPHELTGQLAAFLLEYAQTHFATEEGIMAAYDYPEIEQQRQEHAEFMENAEDLKKRLETDGACRELAIEATGKLLKWLILHIKKHDRDMVAYVKERLGQQLPHPEGAL
jgi:hemerythrin